MARTYESRLRHRCEWRNLPDRDPPSLDEYRGGSPVRNPGQQVGRYRRKLPVWGVTGGYCFYCSAEIDYATFEPDHFEPASRGGETADDNLVPACNRCNASKCDRPYESWIELLASGRSKRSPYVEVY